MTSKRARPAVGRGLFYSRDSGGKHETTPGQYVKWAQSEAAKHGVQFAGTGDQIHKMIAQKCSNGGDLFFDNSVKGNLLHRPGLDALFGEVETDRNVTHVFIPRRDRLARPNAPEEGVELERRLRTAGITIVFQSCTLPPIQQGRRDNIGQTLAAMVDYEASGKFREELAEKMVAAKLALAQRGHAAGGRPPFGFRRFLIGPDGKPVRKLVEGERIRQAGHHVEWLPGPQEELDLIFRILDMLETIPANRVAKILTEEGIPSPDANRVRTDNGTQHVVRGVWHQNTITGIARNKLLQAMVSFGRRGMGELRRLTKSGWRYLEDDDRDFNGKVKVRQTAPEDQIVVPASFEPLVAPQKMEKLTEILDQRSGSQRGKPRSRDPERNPLGGRIYDLMCTWPMYRAAEGEHYTYRCGLYQQSDGCRCNHNRISGPAAARVGVEVIRQQFRGQDLRERLRSHLLKQLSESANCSQQQRDLERANVQLTQSEQSLKTIQSNMARAKSPEILDAMMTEFEKAKAEISANQRRVNELTPRAAGRRNIQQMVEQALETLDRLPELIEGPGGERKAAELFGIVDLKMYLSFDKIKKTKRTVNQLAGGVVTLGSAPPPVQTYTGPTGRRGVKNASEMVSEASNSAEKDESLRNVSRGDRI